MNQSIDLITAVLFRVKGSSSMVSMDITSADVDTFLFVQVFLLLIKNIRYQNHYLIGSLPKSIKQHEKDFVLHTLLYN